MTTEIIKINAAPAKITSNFAAVKAQLQKDLEKYQSIVVTEESLADNKKLATEMNKRAGEIKRLRIDKERELTAPIAEFSTQMKELEGLYLGVRTAITEQNAKFDKQRLDDLEVLLNNERDALRKQYGIEQRYFMAEYDDLVKLGSLTKGGALAKPARDTLDMRVREELQYQERTANRLTKLENACLRAGLEVPLNRENVESFLYHTDDATYDDRLSALINSELQRQEAMQAAADRRAEEKQKADAVQPENQPESNPEANENGQPKLDIVSDDQRERLQAVVGVDPAAPGGDTSATMEVSTSTHPIRTITATFKVPVPENVPDNFVKQKLSAMLSNAGITSLDSITVTRS